MGEWAWIIGGWGKAVRGVMDIPQDEVGHCSLSVVKRAL